MNAPKWPSTTVPGAEASDSDFLVNAINLLDNAQHAGHEEKVTALLATLLAMLRRQAAALDSEQAAHTPV